MASSTVKTITKDISSSVNFILPVSTVLYKNSMIAGQALHINCEVYVRISEVEPNTWFDVGTITLPEGANIPYAKYIPFIGTDSGFNPVLDGLFRINGTTMQMRVSNTNGNYMFINGVIQLNM